MDDFGFQVKETPNTGTSAPVRPEGADGQRVEVEAVRETLNKSVKP